MLTREIGGGGGKNSVVWHFLQLLFVENVFKNDSKIISLKCEKTKEIFKNAEKPNAFRFVCHLFLLKLSEMFRIPSYSETFSKNPLRFFCVAWNIRNG